MTGYKPSFPDPSHRLHEAVERLVNPELAPFSLWIMLAVPLGLVVMTIYIAVTWLYDLFPRPTRRGAVRCLVPLIQSDPALDRKETICCLVFSHGY